MPRIEVLPTTKSTGAPGWAYVPDTGYDPSKVALNPTGARSRARAKAKAHLLGSSETSSALSARQQSAVARRLAELDTEGGGNKEISIPGGAGGRAGGSGKTQATRRILASAKTFANHVADEEAWIAQSGGGGGGGGGAGGGQGAVEVGSAGSRRRSVVGAGRGRGAVSAAVETGATASATPTVGDDAVMAEADDDEDDDALLAVNVPARPSQAELDALLAAPPLPYNAARVAAPDPSAPPPRQFCEICGYWGRVRCVKCGSRVCGRECLASHGLECSRRFA